MSRTLLFLFGLIAISIIACRKEPNAVVEVPDFNFPETHVFDQFLSSYAIFDGALEDLIPSSDFHLVELSSVLYTDEAHKQRLVKVPSGTQMTRLSDGSIDYPDGTILVKTFYYNNNEQDLSLGRRILETRLLIKESGIWNIATYIWDEDQTEACLQLNGADTYVNWISATGSSKSTLYHFPNQNECIACHQSSSSLAPIGPTLRNLNRTVQINGSTLNQLDHLQSLGILSGVTSSQEAQIPDYNDVSVSLADRGRAYLDMNCAHCHNPDGWDIPAEKDFDFRYEKSLDETGIASEKDRILRLVRDGEMPFIGVTMSDEKGIALLEQYLESL